MAPKLCPTCRLAHPNVIHLFENIFPLFIAFVIGIAIKLHPEPKLLALKTWKSQILQGLAVLLPSMKFGAAALPWSTTR